MKKSILYCLFLCTVCLSSCNTYDPYEVDISQIKTIAVTNISFSKQHNVVPLSPSKAFTLPKQRLVNAERILNKNIVSELSSDNAMPNSFYSNFAQQIIHMASKNGFPCLNLQKMNTSRTYQRLLAEKPRTPDSIFVPEGYLLSTTEDYQENCKDISEEISVDTFSKIYVQFSVINLGYKVVLNAEIIIQLYKPSNDGTFFRVYNVQGNRDLAQMSSKSDNFSEIAPEDFEEIKQIAIEKLDYVFKRMKMKSNQKHKLINIYERNSV